MVDEEWRERLRPWILASASPQRRDLLARIVGEFAIRPVDVDETAPPGSLRDAVVAIARRKAIAAAAHAATGTILAADTVVDLDGALLGKPEGPEDAARMLARLSGRAHAVHTGVALVHARSGQHREGVDSTRVVFRRLAAPEIEAYVRSGEPFGKAGAYAIQGGAARFAERIDGDVDTVIGLSSALVREMARQLAARVAVAMP